MAEPAKFNVFRVFHGRLDILRDPDKTNWKDISAVLKWTKSTTMPLFWHFVLRGLSLQGGFPHGFRLLLCRLLGASGKIKPHPGAFSVVGLKPHEAT